MAVIPRTFSSVLAAILFALFVVYIAAAIYVLISAVVQGGR